MKFFRTSHLEKMWQLCLNTSQITHITNPSCHKLVMNILNNIKTFKHGHSQNKATIPGSTSFLGSFSKLLQHHLQAISQVFEMESDNVPKFNKCLWIFSIRGLVQMCKTFSNEKATKASIRVKDQHLKVENYSITKKADSRQNFQKLNKLVLGRAEMV